MFCNKCGAKIQDGAKFCNSCGVRVDEGTDTINPANAINVYGLSEIAPIEKISEEPIGNEDCESLEGGSVADKLSKKRGKVFVMSSIVFVAVIAIAIAAFVLKGTIGTALMCSYT